jgi:glycosyltransferase involved in cell wall biosynthesis
MGAGVPILLIADGEAAAIVSDSEAGLVAAPGDLAGAVASLRRLAEDGALRARLGRNGREAAERKFDRRAIAASFLCQLESPQPW